MKVIYSLIVFVFVAVASLTTLNAQSVGINSTGNAPDASAMLDVSSTNSGILVPRMTLVQRDAISSPATGLMIYQTDNTPGFYYYNGASWAAVSGSSSQGLSEYAYIYNVDPQFVAIEADIAFSTNGNMSGSLTHTAGTSTVTFGSTGAYSIWFSVSAVEPCQFALFLNGSTVTGSIYGSGAGTQINSGMVIINATAGDVLTLRNHSSASAVTLQTLAGGTQTNANASIMIHKID